MSWSRIIGKISLGKPQEYFDYSIIENFENTHNVMLEPDFKNFIINYNGYTYSKVAYTHESLGGTCEFEWLEFRNFEDMDLEEPVYLDCFSHFTSECPDIFKDVLVLGTDSTGGHFEFMYCFNGENKGKVYFVDDMDEDSVSVVSESFGEFLDNIMKLSEYDLEFEEICRNRSFEEAKNYLENYYNNIEDQTLEQTFFHLIIFHKIEFFKDLLDIMLKNGYKFTKQDLITSLKIDDLKFTKELYKKFGKIDNLFTEACKFSSYDILDFLRNEGYDINESPKPPSNQYYPIFSAIFHRNFEAINYLLQNNVNIDVKYNNKSLIDWCKFIIEQNKNYIDIVKKYNNVLEILNKYKKNSNNTAYYEQSFPFIGKNWVAPRMS